MYYILTIYRIQGSLRKSEYLKIKILSKPEKNWKPSPKWENSDHGKKIYYRNFPIIEKNANFRGGLTLGRCE